MQASVDDQVDVVGADDNRIARVKFVVDRFKQSQVS